jgi:hypothetical protein
MKKLHKPLSLLIILLTVINQLGCKDIMQKDISNASITVLSPQENYLSNIYQVVFWWAEIKDVQQYRLQIVRPGFDSIQYFILDTLTSNLKLTLTLFPGKYQWRIRGENGNSYTPYNTRNLTIDTTTNLNNQPFTTLSPQNNFITKSGDVLFTWQSFPYATQYEYYLTDTLNIIQKIKTTTAISMHDTLPEGQYYWKVRAVNTTNSTATQFSSLKKITIDFNGPSPSAPSLPKNNDTVQNTVTITWVRPIDVVADSIYLSTDSTFQSTSNTYRISTATSVILPTLTVNTTYYWRIKSFDAAGNTSVYSTRYRFYLQL